MFHAFMLIETEPGREDTILKEATNIEGVKRGYIVTGMYDLVLELLAAKREVFKDIVEKIRNIEGIKSTQTLITIHPFPEKE